MTLFPRLVLVALSLGLAACNSTPPTASAPTPEPTGYAVNRVTDPGFKLPEGTGCSGAVARYQAVMDNDYATGNVNQSVYHTISGEIASARSACAAGRDGEAQSLIAASKSRHGYPN
jgi:hypothetical protein